MNLHGTSACVGYESNLLSLLEGSFCHRRLSPGEPLGPPAPAALAGLGASRPAQVPSSPENSQILGLGLGPAKVLVAMGREEQVLVLCPEESRL